MLRIYQRCNPGADKVLSAIGEAENTVDWGDYESALAHDIAKIRDEIIEHALKNKWPYVAEHLQDRHIVRRMVLKRSYPDTYDGSADLYVYFYDQGLKLLKPGGRLSYVVTNKWMRAGYAEGLRDVFANKSWIEFVADFGHAKKFFPDADVFPSVIVVRKPDGGAKPADTNVCVIPRDDVPEKALDEAVAKATYPLPIAHFTKESWTLEPPNVVALLNKMRRERTSLTDAAGVKPYRGILTGFNEAFLIDTPTRDAIVSSDPKSHEIIKPFLRGQDVSRWAANWPGLWMIFSRRGIKIDDYPGIKAHLSKYRSRLEPKPSGWEPPIEGEKWAGRKEGTYAWYELQDAIDYWADFDKPKIVYQVIQFYARYCLDTEGRLSNDKTFFLPTDDPWLLAVLNSPLMWWHNWRYLTHLKDEALSPMGYKMDVLPIATATPNSRALASQAVVRDALPKKRKLTTLPLRPGTAVRIDMGSGPVSGKVVWQNSSGVGFSFDTPVYDATAMREGEILAA